MELRVIESLSEVSAAEWNALDPQGNPFLRHEFLLALEAERCADAHSGWRAHHLLLRNAQGELIGAAPLYLKSHSFGEFVFDWSWANAFAQYGLSYYPKLTSAIPFTPATGPRFMTRDESTRRALIQGLRSIARDLKVSSAHALFATDVDIATLCDEGFLLRSDCQFHWRNNGYLSFEDFIATFRADKRKKALRERRRVVEAGVRFEVRSGREMSSADWDDAFALSQGTFAMHGHAHYLNANFFKRIAVSLPDAVVVICAMHRTTLVGVAICFRSATTLYGRYWGQAANYHSLHFETCYFQGIEYCIRHGLQSFEPGTQGEHKIARGFEPTLTHSAHWIADARFADVLAAHLARERQAIERYRDAMRERLPFHRAA